MTNIIYDDEHFHMSIEGHAGTAPAGQDLVCASVTTLALTLGENVRQLEATGSVSACVVDMEDGHAEIACTPAKKMEDVVRLVYHTICIGLAALAEVHPESVRFSAVYGAREEKG